MYLLSFAIQIDRTIWERSGKADYVNQSGVIHSDEWDIYSSVQDALEHSCENPEELEGFFPPTRKETRKKAHICKDTEHEVDILLYIRFLDRLYII